MQNCSNECSSAVRMLVLPEPSIVAFFRATGTVDPRCEPCLAGIGAAMQRHGVETLVPAA